MTKQKPSYAELEFDDIVDMLFNYWKNIAINIFEWKGLEDISPSLTSEIIETTLFDKGKGLFFKDTKLGYMTLPVAPANQLNVYGKATNFRAIGLNYNKQYSIDDAVLIKNNALEIPTATGILYYCKKLADIELTKDLRRNAHKTPLIFECTEDTELTARNLFKKIKANEPVIFKNKTRGEGEVGLNVPNVDVPYINDKLEDEYNSYVAKILTLLGLDNYVEDKKERVQSAEVESNQEYIISSFRTGLEARQKACEAINKMFGLNLSVDYVKAEQIETDEETEDSEEVVENE